MRGVLLAVGVIVVGVAVYLFLQEPAVAAPGSAAGEVAKVAASGDADPERAEAAAGTDAVVGAKPSAAPEREAAGAVEGAPEPNVRVVRFGTGEPVAGAEVWCQPPDFDWQGLTAERRQQLAALSRDYEAFLKEVGRVVRTDAAGLCHVPLGSTGVSVVARAEGAFVQGWLRADAADVQELVLRRDHTMRVVVVDARGEPAAARLIFEATDPKPDETHTWHLGGTGHDGEYVVQHVQQYAGDQATRRLRARATIPGGGSEPVEFETTDPPAEVRLKLPGTGAVRVRMLDAAGEPIDLSLVTLTPRFKVVDEPPDDPASVFRGVFVHGSDGLERSENEFVYPSVALGKYVVLGMTAFDGYVHGPGPTVAQPVVTFELREGDGDAVLTGVLQDEHEAPLAAREFRMRYERGHSRGSGGGRTAADGRFRIANEHAIGDGVVLAFDVRGEDGALERTVQLEARTVAAGKNDLGAIQLLPPAVLLSGRVVRGEGVDARRPTLGIERRVGSHWQQEWNMRFTWQDDERFSLPGSMPADSELRLTVGQGTYLPVDPIPFAVGATDVEVPLHAAGSASATFLVDDGLPLHRLSCSFERVGEKPAEGIGAQLHREMSSRLYGPAVDGRVKHQWIGLEPGRYVLTVVVEDSDTVLARLDGVVVETGPCQDPRLNDIDLRGRVRGIDLRVLGADGAPIEDRDAFVMTCDADGDWRGYHLGSGVARLATAGSVDVTVLAPGHEVLRVAAVTASQTLSLKAAARRRIRVDVPGGLPEGHLIGLRLRPQLGLERNSRIQLDTGRGTTVQNFLHDEFFARDGVCEVTVRWPGRYDVETIVRAPRTRSMTVRGAQPAELDLGAAGDLSVQVAKDRLDSLLERIEKIGR